MRNSTATGRFRCCLETSRDDASTATRTGPSTPAHCARAARRSVAFNSFVSIPLCAPTARPASCLIDPDIVTPPAHGMPRWDQQRSGDLHAERELPGAGLIHLQEQRRHFRLDHRHDRGHGGGAGTGAGAGPDVTAASITNVSVFPRRWRRGRALPRFSARVGTRIRWRLSEPARVTLTFQRARPGRRVGRLCLPPTRSLGANPRCTRFTRAGRLTRPNAKAGLNTLRFQGRLTRRKRLALGVYRVLIGAVDAAGNRSKSRRSRTFRIVAR